MSALCTREPCRAVLRRGAGPVPAWQFAAAKSQCIGSNPRPPHFRWQQPQATSAENGGTGLEARLRYAAKPLHPSTKRRVISSWLQSLPSQRFQALLTLFSKSFSPFPHGTYSLSDSVQYLAFDENYHQLCAPLPKNATRRFVADRVGFRAMNYGAVTLCGAFFQKDVRPAPRWQEIFRLQFGDKSRIDTLS